MASLRNLAVVTPLPDHSFGAVVSDFNIAEALASNQTEQIRAACLEAFVEYGGASGGVEAVMTLTNAGWCAGWCAG